ncbi:MAG: SCP2 sterol-binding domain-containing protein, partial [Deltaproteobacteria bacterium]|nr:SCP2 sterol-binding domain-containing protein [Deltaproteobacteria bacterium]
EGFQAEDADLTVTIDRADLEATMMGKKTLMAQIEDGTAKIEGDKGVLEKLASTLTVFEMGFEIMPGTKAPAPEEDLNPYEVGPVDLHGE